MTIVFGQLQSRFSTQALQWRQWCARGGRLCRHREHGFDDQYG